MFIAMLYLGVSSFFATHLVHKMLIVSTGAGVPAEWGEYISSNQIF